MENASKALIIAGAILLSILIIALGIYVFNMAKNATSMDSLTEMEKSQFNSNYRAYEGKRLGSMVEELIGLLIDNATSNNEADERLIDIVYVDSRNKITKDSLGITGSASDGDTKAATAAKSQVGIEGDTGVVHIFSNSGADSLNVDAMGKLRSNMAARHYYEISVHINNTSGLVDCVVIDYDA